MDVTFDLLAELIGEELQFTAASELTVGLRIAAAEPNPEGAPGGSIDLVGPRSPALDQGTFPIHHATRGNGILFIVPVGESETTRTYQAVFG